jgi:hypothetical protein
MAFRARARLRRRWRTARRGAIDGDEDRRLALLGPGLRLGLLGAEVDAGGLEQQGVADQDGAIVGPRPQAATGHGFELKSRRR